ncbi:MAG: tetratricopeptide repeat protein [Chloroflexi bacterium]|nr:tetratricopeptide repeat protein [Chloroflexota bacterium]
MEHKRFGAIQLPQAKLARLLAFGLVLVSLKLYSGWGSAPAVAPAPSPPAAAPLPSEDRAADQTIRFLEDRVRRDPEDFGAYNRLAGSYLQRLRETGNTEYLSLAFRAARRSLDVIPAERNIGGLSALAQAEYASHEFAAARDHALQLTELDAGKSYPYGMLGDALLELGEYEEATEAFRQMAARSGQSVGTDTRLARLAALRGETERAQGHLFTALAFALDLPVPPRETVAWCRWQFGEAAFAVGDYETAERHYRDALVTFPGYYNALASLGRVRAARGDIAAAIEQYEDVVLRLPDPTFVAALGDLYTLAGRPDDAATQYALVEQIARLSALNGALYNRQLALFYADHDLNADVAYANAVAEYQERRDVYGADAVAWTALKAGKLAEAQAAMQEALRLGTRDARLFYHAGMIARAAGDEATARDDLERALALNPGFDPLQSHIARGVVAALGEGARYGLK